MLEYLFGIERGGVRTIPEVRPFVRQKAFCGLKLALIPLALAQIQPII